MLTLMHRPDIDPGQGELGVLVIVAAGAVILAVLQWALAQFKD